MNYFSFHTHSTFCDGKASMEEVCQKALDLNLSALGFSSHAPVPFATPWAMKFEDVLEYKKEIDRCKEKFGHQIIIYSALEADYVPNDRSVSYQAWKNMLNLDYIIGSVHLVQNPKRVDDLWFLDGPPENYENGVNNVFEGDIKAAVRQYYIQIQQMVETQKPDVIAHFDKVIMNNKGRFFTEDEPWYQEVLEDTLQLIAGTGTIIEVNTRGIYRGKYHTFFPCESIIKRCVELEIPLTIAVDAHHPDELIAEFEHAAKIIEQMGGKHVSYFNNGKWEQMPIKDVY